MSRQAKPTVIGGFVIGVVILLVVMGLFFGKGDYFSDKKRFVMYFNGSVKGLQTGAPVTIKGVQIGEVVEIDIESLPKTLELVTPVYVDIDHSKFQHLRGNLDEKEIMSNLIGKGLRAQLRTESLLTGLLYIEVDFHPETPVQYQSHDGKYPEFPTVPTELEALTHSLEKLDVSKLVENVHRVADGLETLINDPQMQQLATTANTALTNISELTTSAKQELRALRGDIKPVAEESHKVLATINQDLPVLFTRVNSSLDKLDIALTDYASAGSDIAHAFSDDSPTLHQLRSAAEEVERAAAALRELSETLNSQPEALVQGKQ